MNIEHGKEQREGGHLEVSSEHCSAKLGRGASAKEMPSHMLVVDTGQPWVPEHEQCSPETQEELDRLYRETIQHGIVDHHGIDSVVPVLPEGVRRRCSTNMIADFAPEVLAVIKDRGVSSVTSHFDSDLDSVSATYLAKALVQSGDVARMPKITKSLAEFVHSVDFPSYLETDPHKFSQSLLGIFGSVKTAIMGKQRVEMGRIWGDKAKTIDEKRRESGEAAGRYSQEVVDRSIEILNACEKISADSDIDFQQVDVEALDLSEKTRSLLVEGTEKTIEDFDKFNQEFERAERAMARVKTKDGSMLDVPVIIFENPDMDPLMVTNMSYIRVSPETIVAVFAGGERKYGGDHYDIGIKPETTALYDLKSLEMPMNQVEEDLRQDLFGNLETIVSGGQAPTAEQQAILDQWKLSPEQLLNKWRALRPGFEHTGHGDPSVVVAGGSLLAASTTSLMTPERFREILAKQLETK